MILVIFTAILTHSSYLFIWEQQQQGITRKFVEVQKRSRCPLSTYKRRTDLGTLVVPFTKTAIPLQTNVHAQSKCTSPCTLGSIHYLSEDFQACQVAGIHVVYSYGNSSQIVPIKIVFDLSCESIKEIG